MKKSKNTYTEAELQEAFNAGSTGTQGFDEFLSKILSLKEELKKEKERKKKEKENLIEIYKETNIFLKVELDEENRLDDGKFVSYYLDEDGKFQSSFLLELFEERENEEDSYYENMHNANGDREFDDYGVDYKTHYMIDKTLYEVQFHGDVEWIGDWSVRANLPSSSKVLSYTEKEYTLIKEDEDYLKLQMH